MIHRMGGARYQRRLVFYQTDDKHLEMVRCGMLCKTVELTKKISNGQLLALIEVDYVAGDDDERWQGEMNRRADKWFDL